MSTSTVWPMLLDISKEDCKRLLRRLELDAYASLVSAFRAQGDLTKDKKKVLQELCTILGISTERHRAEVRRVVNDERLATIADAVAGCSDYSEWAVEGRRLVPLMPRLVPQTAFTNIANANATIAAQQNVCLPPPSVTKNIKENLPVPVGNSIPLVKSSPKAVVSDDHLLRISPQITCPTDNDPFLAQHEVVVSTSLGDEDDKGLHEFSPVNVDDSLSDKPRKRRRTSSNDSGGVISQIVVKGNTPSPSFSLATVSTSSSSSTSSSPISSSRTVSIPIGGPLQFTLTGGSSSKLTASTTSALNSLYPTQKVFLVSTSCANLPSSILQRSLTVPMVKTVTGTNSSVTVSSQSTGRPTSSLITPISSSTPVSLVLSSANTSSTLTTSQSGGTSLKIIAQTVPVSAANRLRQKITLGSGIPPIVVVTKTSVGKACQPGTRLVNVIGAQSTACKSVPSLVTVGPKGKQAALVKVAPGMSLSAATGGKPNVFVVQKSHMLQQFKQSQPVSAFAISASSFSGTQTMLKAGLSLNKDAGFKLPTVAALKSRGSSIATTYSSGDISNPKKSSVLADLLQAAGILPDGGVGVGGGGGVAMEAGHSYLADQSIVKVVGGDVITGDLKANSAIDISSFVDQLKSKETVNVFNQSCFAQPPELVTAQQPSAKLKLTKLESGMLDPKTGRFAPFPVNICATDRLEATRTESKNVASLSLEALIQNSLNDNKRTNFVEGSTLRRELLAGKIEFKPVAEASTPSEATESFPQSIRTFLYKGATYSKGDVASHRKKVNECLLPAGVEAASSVASGSEDSDIIGFQDAFNEQEVQFTDDNLTAVVEETVVTTDDFVPVDLDVCSQLMEATREADVNRITQEERFVSNQQTPIKVVATRANTPSVSGSSVFMVSDSSFGNSDSSQLDSVERALQSPYIIQQGLCGIEGLEGSSETLEIIGSTEDFDSVESRVAALHGEDDVSEFHQSFLDIHGEGSVVRKKKTPGSDEPVSALHSSGWYRAATGLLHRVMKYRGPNRFKGELSAAHWFLHPVSIEEAPGYHKIVINPMDFTTILKKLEKFAYKDMSEFHEDMLLVKHNCELYNPDDHPARLDCEHVFTFYQQEYNKLLHKTQFISSSQKKKKI